MSALGQKRTCAVQTSMSALPPIATAKADIGKSSGLLYPRKRTCAAHKLMSALGQKRTLLLLFDHLVGGQKQGQAVSPGAFAILRWTTVFELGRRLYRKISWLVATQDTVDVGRQRPCMAPAWA